MRMFRIRHYYNKGIKNPSYRDWQWRIILYIFNKLNLIESTRYQPSLNI